MTSPIQQRAALRTYDDTVFEPMPERKARVGRVVQTLLSWLRPPARPPDVPDYLRTDLGLGPVAETSHFVDIAVRNVARGEMPTVRPVDPYR